MPPQATASEFSQSIPRGLMVSNRHKLGGLASAGPMPVAHI